MKTYIFNGYLLNGSGKVNHLASWDFSCTDYYFFHQRPLADGRFVKFPSENTISGMAEIVIEASSLKEALFELKDSLTFNHLDIVLSGRYICISDGKKSTRYFRPV